VEPLKPLTLPDGRRLDVYVSGPATSTGWPAWARTTSTSSAPHSRVRKTSAATSTVPGEGHLSVGLGHLEPMLEELLALASL